MSKRRYEYSDVAGWSFSRYDTFRTCKRQYYFEYYGKKHAPPEIMERIDFLKSLLSSAILLGQIVHDAIATILRKIQSMNEEIPLDDLREKATRVFSETLAGSLLLDTYYGAIITPARKFELEFQLESCLESFYASKWYQELKSTPDERKAKWIIEPEDFGEFRLDGMKAYARVDFAFPSEDGYLNIIDWKTGKRYDQKHAIQMQGYILYAHDVHGFPLEKIRAILEYLSDSDDPVECVMNQAHLESFKKRVRKELTEMHSFCQNVERNFPLSMEYFPLRDDSRACGWCRYRELCSR
ncbi:MAG: PD-(D/E)XK nuclease family protein [Acidobacteriota bacterium]